MYVYAGIPAVFCRKFLIEQDLLAKMAQDVICAVEGKKNVFFCL